MKNIRNMRLIFLLMLLPNLISSININLNASNTFLHSNISGNKANWNSHHSKREKDHTIKSENTEFDNRFYLYFDTKVNQTFKETKQNNKKNHDLLNKMRSRKGNKIKSLFDEIEMNKEIQNNLENDRVNMKILHSNKKNTAYTQINQETKIIQNKRNHAKYLLDIAHKINIQPNIEFHSDFYRQMESDHQNPASLYAQEVLGHDVLPVIHDTQVTQDNYNTVPGSSKRNIHQEPKVSHAGESGKVSGNNFSQELQSSSFNPQNAAIRDPEITPGLFQGDIATDLNSEEYVRLGINFAVSPEKKWQNKTVPYSISPLYLPAERIMIDTAINVIQFFTCIEFVSWDGVVEDYLLILPIESPSGCWSYVGRKGGQQLVALQKADAESAKCFVSLGKPLHELLHALGLYHEHIRTDRDNYVEIIYRNILSYFWINFDKLKKSNTENLFPYDYDSVMHYGKYFFSFDKASATILPRDVNAKIGQREMLSRYDCLKLNHMYDCLNSDKYNRDMYTEFCTQLAF